MIFLLGKFVLSDSNGSSDVDNDLTYPPVKSYEPISFPTPGKIGNDKPSDEENSDKFQGLTNGMKYHESWLTKAVETYCSSGRTEFPACMIP